jgi:hypothetical protein
MPWIKQEMLPLVQLGSGLLMGFSKLAMVVNAACCSVKVTCKLCKLYQLTISINSTIIAETKGKP